MGAGGCRMLGYLSVYFILYDSVDCCKCRGRADRQTDRRGERMPRYAGRHAFSCRLNSVYGQDSNCRRATEEERRDCADNHLILILYCAGEDVNVVQTE